MHAWLYMSLRRLRLTLELLCDSARDSEVEFQVNPTSFFGSLSKTVTVLYPDS